MTIQKRTVLYTKEKGRPIRFTGWALVTTPMGAMVEPFCANDRFTNGTSIRDFDPSDEMSRIDDLQNTTNRLEWKSVNGGETMPIHGGNLQPRTYITNGNF